MKFEVLDNFKVKTEKGIIEIRKGQFLEMDIAKASKLIEIGKLMPVFDPIDDLNERMAIMGENTESDQIKPYVTDFGVLVIPWNSDPRYHYWKKGGQSVCDTLKELGRWRALKYGIPEWLKIPPLRA